MKKSKTSKRTVIQPHEGDRRFARRDKQGEFKKQVSVGRSLPTDRKTKAKTKVLNGQGHRGDRSSLISSAPNQIWRQLNSQILPLE